MKNNLKIFSFTSLLLVIFTTGLLYSFYDLSSDNLSSVEILNIIESENSECLFSKNTISNNLKKEFPNSEIVYINKEISIFPEIKNIKCLTKVDSVLLDTGLFNTYSGNKIIHVAINTSTNINYLITFLSFTFLLLIFNNFFQNNFYLFFVTSLIFSTLINIFFNPDFTVYDIGYVLVPPLIIYIFLDKVLGNQVKEYFENFLSNIPKNKNKLYLLFLIFHFPLFMKIIKFEYSIDYYLINYNYGFIKRGFLGSIFYNLPIQPQLKLLSISIFLILIYLLTIHLVINLFVKNKQNIFSLLMLLSPSFLLFPIYQIINNEDGGVATPELFGVLSVLLLLQYGTKINHNKYFFSWFIVFVVSILIHEVNIFTLPFVGYFIFKMAKRKSYLKFGLLIFIFLSIFTFFYYQSSDMNSEISSNICRDLLEMDLRDSICDNAVNNLKLDHLQDVRYKYTKNLHWNWFTALEGSYTSYILVFFLSLLPLFLATKYRKLLPLMLSSLIFYIPLFLNAWDWGRWIFLYSSLMYIYYFWNSSEKYSELTTWNLLALFLYTTTWYSSYCCSADFLQLQNILKNNLALYIIFLPLFVRKIKQKKSLPESDIFGKRENFD